MENSAFVPDHSPVSTPDVSRDDLAVLPLFRGLSARELFRAESTLHRKQVPAGAELMSQEQAGDIVYIIARGAVRICVQRGGRQIIIGLRGAGDVLGEMSVLDGDRRSATVITQTECALFWVSRAEFWETLWPMPQFSLNLTGLLAKRVRTLTGQLEAMATLAVPGRLARLLLSLAEDYGIPGEVEGLEIPFRLTQADLANMIAGTRVQVNQIFHVWRKRGIIQIQNQRIQVMDLELLRALVG